MSHVSPIKAAVTWALGAGEELGWRMFLDLASITRIAGRDGHAQPRRLQRHRPTCADAASGRSASALRPGRVQPEVTGIEGRAARREVVRAGGVDHEPALAGTVGHRHAQRLEQRVVLFRRRGRPS